MVVFGTYLSRFHCIVIRSSDLPHIRVDESVLREPLSVSAASCYTLTPPYTLLSYRFNSTWLAGVQMEQVGTHPRSTTLLPVLCMAKARVFTSSWTHGWPPVCCGGAVWFGRSGGICPPPPPREGTSQHTHVLISSLMRGNAVWILLQS